MKHIKSSVLCASLLFGGIAYAQDYYVATNGNDSNTGTINQPFASIQRAVNEAGPSTTIYVRGGTYREVVNLNGVSGTAGSPVTLTAFEGEDVILDGTVDITTNWTKDQGKVYRTTIPEDITQLFVDDKLMTLARFPNGLAFSDVVFTEQGARRTRAAKGANGRLTDSEGAGPTVASTGISFTDCIGVLNFATFISDSRVIRTHVAGTGDMTYDNLVSYKKSPFYFLEGGVGPAERKMIDTPQEWGYDETNNELWLWADNGQNPNGRKIVGKTKTFLMSGNAATKHVTIDGINFFAGTFTFKKSDGITIQNCDFDYFSASTRAIGDITRSATSRFVGVDSDRCEDIKIYNCNFRHADGRALYGEFIENLTIENNLFYKIDYACSADLRFTEPGADPGSATALNLVATNNLVYRRNTIDTAGGAQVISVNGGPSLFEYNYHTKCGSQQTDGSTIYMVGASMTDSVARHNWFYANHKRDFRYDGNNNPLTGIGGIYYRNVSVSTIAKGGAGTAARLKGDLHDIFNNLGVGEYSDINIAVDKGGNARSITHNNAANILTADPIPGIASHNYDGQEESKTIEELLRDPENFDFRPKANAVELVDRGRLVSATRFDGTSNEVKIPVTDDFIGSAPDIGAYEYGDTVYWIGGRQEAQASTPIPKDGGVNVPTDADLMYLIGLNGTRTRVFLGTNEDNLDYVETRQFPNNIVSPTLESGRTYFWRVDTRVAGKWLEGNIWSFTTAGQPSNKVVTLRKRNANGFALDGGNGGENGQNVYLWNFNANNVNQQFVEVDRGGGFYSYIKQGTNFALDGGNGGETGQNLYLWTSKANNFNQHWKKVSKGGNVYQLQKRNSLGFSIDGGVGGATGQNVYLWSSGNSNQNQQWIIEYK